MKKGVRRAVVLLLMALLTAGALAEGADLYTYPATYEEGLAYHLRPLELMAKSFYPVKDSIMIAAADQNRFCLSLYLWRPGSDNMDKICDGLYDARGDAVITEVVREIYEDLMSRVPLVTVPDPEHFISALASDGERLYGVCLTSGKIFTLSGDGKQPIFEDVAQISRVSADDSNSKLPETVNGCAVAGQRMILTNRECVISVNLRDGSWQQWALKDIWRAAEREGSFNEQLLGVCALNDREALLTLQHTEPGTQAAESGWGAVMALETGTMRPLDAPILEKMSPESLKSLCYVPSLGAYLYAEDGKIMGSSDLASAEIYTWFPLDVRSFACAGTEVLGSDESWAIAFRRLTPEKTALRELRVQSGLVLEEREKRAFAQEHPDTCMTSVDELDCLEALRADDPVDTALVPHDTRKLSSGEEPAFEVLVREGMLADLSGYPEIMAYVDSLNPVFREYVTRNGQVLGVPVSAGSGGGWWIDREALEYAGLSVEDVPTNLVDLCAFITRWNDGGVTSEISCAPIDSAENYRERMLEIILEEWGHYCEATGQELHFSDPLLDEMLDALEKMRCDKLDAANQVPEEEISDYRRPILTTDGQTVGRFTNFTAPGSNITWLPMSLTADTQPVHGIQEMELMVMRKGTEQAELAAQFMLLAIKSMAETDKHVLIAGYEHPVESADYPIRRAYLVGRLDELTGEDPARNQEIIGRFEERLAECDLFTRWSIAPDSIVFYRETLLPTLYIQTVGSMATRLNEAIAPGNADEGEVESGWAALCRRYLDGTLDRNAFVEGLDGLQRDSR